MRIPMRGISRPVGLGDVVHGALAAMRIPQCGPCKQRQARMNQAVQFVPRKVPQAPRPERMRR